METVQQFLQHLSQHLDFGPWALVACLYAALAGWIVLLLTCVAIVAMTGSTEGLKDFALVVSAYRRMRLSPKPKDRSPASRQEMEARRRRRH